MERLLDALWVADAWSGEIGSPADWKVGDTADRNVCGTGMSLQLTAGKGLRKGRAVNSSKACTGCF
jgi:hypothetical protein